MSQHANTQYQDFYRYTSGRWLWDEEEQLRDRYRKFDVPELQRLAAESVGAFRCIEMTKLAEGAFNKVFRLVMDNGKVAIARIPNPNAGPAYYTTASEVATMDFVRTVLQVPVPQVFAWSANASNAVGAEYIIMEEVPGTHAGSMWEACELEQKVAIMKELVLIEQKLASISFASYGNLYYSNENMKGTLPAVVAGDVSADLKNDVRSRFVVGPVVDRGFWDKERSAMNIDRGPWKTSQEYILAIAYREIAWIDRYATARSSDDPLTASVAQNSPDAHISLLRKYLAIAPYLSPSDPDLVAACLWHKDLHSGNIFIDKCRITSIIDWQSTWIGPLYLQARHAKLIDYNGEMMLRPPSNFKELNNQEQVQIKEKVANSIILHLYELRTAEQNPILSKIFRAKYGRTRAEPIEFAGATWEDDILPFREALIRVERYWDELDTNAPCPIQFTDEELDSHRKDADGWNEVQEFWDSIKNIVSSDGWTPIDRYDEAVALFSDLRQKGLKIMVGKEKEEFDEQTRWADKAIR